MHPDPCFDGGARLGRELAERLFGQLKDAGSARDLAAAENARSSEEHVMEASEQLRLRREEHGAAMGAHLRAHARRSDEHDKEMAALRREVGCAALLRGGFKV